MGKALYRKYRPTTLRAVIGQDTVVSALQEAIKKHKISHAYLFTGPRGCGKTSVARIFAHEINHFPYQLEDSYVDIIEIDAASNRGIDNIRDLREKATIAPTTGQYKVYIIDEVHMLTKEAFNALLKILEEPPAHVVFILATTDPQKIPVTITSRAQSFIFKLATPDIMQQHLSQIASQEQIKITPEALALIVKRGGGSFRDSISLLDQISNLSEQEITPELVTNALGLPTDDIIQHLLSAYQNSAFTEVTAILKDALNSGIKPDTITSELIDYVLADPQPVFIPLLSALTNVSPPFAEAKLLLALIPREVFYSSSSDMLSGRVRPTGSTEATSPVTTGARQRPESISAATGQQASRSASARPESISATTGHQNPRSASTRPESTSATISQPQDSSSAPAPSDFSWSTYLAAVATSSSAVASALQNSTHQLSGNILHIFPNKSIYKRVLDSPNNRQVLANHAPHLQITIHDAGEQPATTTAHTTSSFSHISAIMGDVQEVNLDGESVPF